MPTVALCPLPKLGFGKPPAGSKLWTYAAGTVDTPLAAYTDALGTTPQTNPIIFDSRGEANVWLAVGFGYKLAHLSAGDVPIWSVDNIILSAGGGAAGPPGPAGPAGPAGPTGPAGSGLPSGALIEVITGNFAASAYAGQVEIPIAGFFTANKRVLNVELTVTQQFGASNGLASMRLGDSVTQDRFGSGITLTTGVKPQRDGDAPMFTTATSLSLFADGGPFDATGTATVRALVISLS